HHIFKTKVELASHLFVLEKASPETLSLMFGEVSLRLPVLEKVVLASKLFSRTSPKFLQWTLSGIFASCKTFKLNRPIGSLWMQLNPKGSFLLTTSKERLIPGFLPPHHLPRHH